MVKSCVIPVRRYPSCQIHMTESKLEVPRVGQGNYDLCLEFQFEMLEKSGNRYCGGCKALNVLDTNAFFKATIKNKHTHKRKKNDKYLLSLSSLFLLLLWKRSLPELVPASTLPTPGLSTFYSTSLSSALALSTFTCFTAFFSLCIIMSIPEITCASHLTHLQPLQPSFCPDFFTEYRFWEYRCN